MGRPDGNRIVELLNDAVCARTEAFEVERRPPVHEIAVQVELMPLVIKAVRHFMTDRASAGRTTLSASAACWSKNERCSCAAGRTISFGEIALYALTV